MNTLFGRREITAEDFAVARPAGDAFQWMDDLVLVNGEAIGGYNVALTATCNVDEVLGTNVNTFENDDYVNVYVNLLPWLSEVEPKLDVTLCKGDGSDEYFERPLNEREQTAILLTVLRAMPEFIGSIIASEEKRKVE